MTILRTLTINEVVITLVTFDPLDGRLLYHIVVSRPKTGFTKTFTIDNLTTANRRFDILVQAIRKHIENRTNSDTIEERKETI